MSVYTRVESDELLNFLARYDVGKLIRYEGIADGIENTNYRIQTEQGLYVLTIFEHFDNKQIPFFFELTQHLSSDGIPCTRALCSKDGLTVTSIANKPAALFSFLPGSSPTKTTNGQIRALGHTLASIHVSLESFESQNVSPDDPHWMAIDALETCTHRMCDEDVRLFREEYEFQQRFQQQQLLHGYIHGDLFRDNCLVQGNSISGILDFYSASYGPLILDIAIAATDWCRTEELLDFDRVNILLNAYHEKRPLSNRESECWPSVLRFAAFRFWCSRLYDQLHPQQSVLNVVKDPNEYKQLLIFLRGKRRSPEHRGTS